MSGVRNMAQGISSINKLNAAIRTLPLRIRTAIAKDAQPILDAYIREDFAAGRTVYDSPRPLSVDGKPLTLVKSGAVKRSVGFVVIGTILRAQLSTKYAKYLVGKYQILPQSLPAKWRVELERLVREYAEDFQREALR